MLRRSFNFKLISLIIVICITLSSLSAFILYRNHQDTHSYQTIASNSLPKVKILGEILATFRQLRIEVRSLGIEGNTAKDNQTYKENALKEITSFEKSLSEFESHIQKDFEIFVLSVQLRPKIFLSF